MPKAYQELTFTDDFMFSRVLYTEPELCRALLELLLPLRIDRLELPAFLTYIHEGRLTGASGGLVHSLESAVVQAREGHKWEVDYMTYMEHLQESYAEGQAEGRAAGEAKGILETLMALVRRKEITAGLAAEMSGQPEEIFSDTGNC